MPQLLAPDYPLLVRAVLDGYALAPWGTHGLSHWARVWENGLRLAEATGADPTIVRLFAIYHDSCRLNDGCVPPARPSRGRLSPPSTGAEDSSCPIRTSPSS